MWKRRQRQISYATCYFIRAEILLLRAWICNMSWQGRLICICNSKWSEFSIMQNISTKKLQCNFTPPFKMASRLIAIALFYLHHYVVRDGICLYETSLSKDSERLIRNECSRGTHASWESLIFLWRTFIQFQCQYQP